MATLSVAARNAALVGLIAHLEDGVAQARPSFLSRDAGAVTIHNTFMVSLSPPGQQLFDIPSGGVASKTALPWFMPVSASGLRIPVTWEIRTRANVVGISGTYGGPGSGADIEFDETPFAVRIGNSVSLLTFALAMT